MPVEALGSFQNLWESPVIAKITCKRWILASECFSKVRHPVCGWRRVNFVERKVISELWSRVCFANILIEPTDRNKVTIFLAISFFLVISRGAVFEPQGRPICANSARDLT